MGACWVLWCVGGGVACCDLEGGVDGGEWCVVYKKHYPPALHDEVWRLDKIGKDGAFHKRLNQAHIMTVEHFLRLVVMDPQRLRNVSTYRRECCGL